MRLWKFCLLILALGFVPFQKAFGADNATLTSQVTLYCTKITDIISATDLSQSQNQGKIDEVVSALRSLQVTSVGAPPKVLALAIGPVFKASVTPSINGVVSREANITLSGIGYGREAVAQYASLTIDSDEKVRGEAAKLLEEKTRDNRTLLIDNGLQATEQAFIEAAARPSLSLALQSLWAIMKSPTLLDLTLPVRTQAFLKFPFVRLSELSNISSYTYIVDCVGPTLVIRGAALRRNLLDALEVAIRDYQINGRKREDATLILNLNYLLCKQDDSSAWRAAFGPDRTTWSEVNSFPASERAALNQRLVSDFGKELDLISTDPPPLAGNVHIRDDFFIVIPLLGRDATVLIPKLRLITSQMIFTTGTREEAQRTITRLQAL